MDHNIFIASLTVWREARGEIVDGQRAVAHVINNRAVEIAKSYDLNRLPEEFYYKVCTAAWQFSSMTAKNDPQLGMYPDENDTIFKNIISIVDGITTGTDSDLTSGATHYFNPGIVLPTWAKTMTKVASIGHHDFYKH